MNGEAEAKKISSRRAATVNAVTLRISGSLVTMAMLLWAIRSGFKLATDSARYIGYTDWAFRIGVLTMLLGFMFLLLGIPILADLFLNLSEQMQLQEEAGIQKVIFCQFSVLVIVSLSSQICFHNSHMATRDTKTISKVIAGIFATVFALIVLRWAIYTGFKLATHLRRDGEYHFLTTSIRVLSIIFGFVYFIIGLNIIAELGRDLFDHMKQREKREPTVLKVEGVIHFLDYYMLLVS